MTKQLRRTKIIATLGPATDSDDVLAHIIEAGVDVVRLNFSHGTAGDHEKRVKRVRDISAKLGKEIGIIADLQGPKIRVNRFKAGKVNLEIGKEFILDMTMAEDAGDQHAVGVAYKNLINDIHPGDHLLLDDGRIELEVKKIQAPKIICEVLVGGELSNNKGLNRRGGGLSAEALTDKDRQDLKTAIRLDVDYIAVSFPRCADDIHNARKLIKAAKGHAGIIAKIERAEAIAVIDEIINASDAVMVARGDLGVEIGDAELPEAQKHIIQRARSLDTAVITATQMMESMISSVLPTRAEIFDVSNAVTDGTDAVMLSAETATGRYPVHVVKAMDRACLGAEKQRRMQVSKHRVECEFKRVDEAIAMATMYIANHYDITAIIALTESGLTPLWMSRIRSGIPIYGLTRHISTQRRMTLYRGVYPLFFDSTNIDRRQLNKKAVAVLEKLDYVKQGDQLVITKGNLVGVHGQTNALKIVEVGKVP